MRAREVRWMRVSVGLTGDKERVWWCPGDGRCPTVVLTISAPRILLFGCAHSLLAEDSVCFTREARNPDYPSEMSWFLIVLWISKFYESFCGGGERQNLHLWAQFGLKVTLGGRAGGVGERREERSICGTRLPGLWEGMQLNAQVESIL